MELKRIHEKLDKIDGDVTLIRIKVGKMETYMKNQNDKVFSNSKKIMTLQKAFWGAGGGLVVIGIILKTMGIL